MMRFCKNLTKVGKSFKIRLLRGNDFASALRRDQRCTGNIPLLNCLQINVDIACNKGELFRSRENCLIGVKQ